jgi:hypothetical protein
MVAYEKIKIEASKDVEVRMYLDLFIHSRYFQDIQKSSSSKMKSLKVGNLPLEFLVQVRVSRWEVLVLPQPKRLPHGLIQVLHGGI